MTIEVLLDRIATALERTATAFEAPFRIAQAAEKTVVAEQGKAPAAETQTARRGPGRPPKAEAAAAQVSATPAPSAEAGVQLGSGDGGGFLDDEPDPVVEALPTIEDVRRALVDYGKRVNSQEKARTVLKQHGHVDILKTLKPEHYKAVIAAARA